MPHLPKWTYGLVAAGSPVAGFPLWQAVLGFHIAAWIAQVPLSLSNVKGCCFNHYFNPLNLAPFFSSLAMVSLKAGHQRSLTLGIRSSSLLLLSSNISKCPLAGLHHCPTVCSPGGLYFLTDYDDGFDHYDDGRNNLQHSVTTIFMSRCSSSLATATPSTRSA